MFKTMNGFTKAKMKEVIDQEFTGLSSDGETCKYRFKGLKCAIGCFIPDSVYHRTFEGNAINVLWSVAPGIQKLMPLGLSGLISFQDAHDFMDDIEPEEAKKRLLDWIDKNIEDGV